MLQISWRMEAEKGIVFYYLANGLTRTASNPPPEQIAAMLKAEPPDKWSLLNQRGQLADPRRASPKRIFCPCRPNGFHSSV